jgi:hypothetical protein
MHRNLGRDDRLVSDHGREARHPFLDESVMQQLLATPLHLLADLSAPPGALACTHWCCRGGRALQPCQTVMLSLPGVNSNACIKSSVYVQSNVYVVYTNSSPFAACRDLAFPYHAMSKCAPGVGDKRLLRAVLASLGCPAASQRVKRAIQFGTHLGQMSNKRDFGSNRRANAVSAGQLRLAASPPRRLLQPALGCASGSGDGKDGAEQAPAE